MDSGPPYTLDWDEPPKSYIGTESTSGYATLSKIQNLDDHAHTMKLATGKREKRFLITSRERVSLAKSTPGLERIGRGVFLDKRTTLVGSQAREAMANEYFSLGKYEERD